MSSPVPAAPDHGAEPDFEQLLADTPSNWGRWGPDDELGMLNVLNAAQVAIAAASVQAGKVFTLGLKLANPAGDPIWPDRVQAQRHNVQDRGTYLAGKAMPTVGGVEYADDMIVTYLQGTTHADALGHNWYGGRLYNGHDASTTVGSLSKASILPIAEHGIVGRAVLLDIPRLRGKDHLEHDEPFALADLLAAADRQHLEIRPHDILLIRTGWLSVYYSQGPASFYRDPYSEPGLIYTPEVTDWFHDLDIAAFATDTAGNELTIQPRGGPASPLHASLMRNLGVVFMEMLWLEELATDCAADGRYEGFFVAAPLKVVGGTGGPVNPVLVK